MPSPRYCWDACVFIAFLTKEPRDQEETNGILEVIDLVDRHQATIITTSLIRTEVLDDAAHPDLPTALENIFRRPTCVAIDLNRAISEKAGSIRSACRTSGRSLKAADAVYIATAILNGASALHTFDDKLLGLSGRSEVDHLVICKPRAQQTVLPL